MGWQYSSIKRGLYYQGTYGQTFFRCPFCRYFNETLAWVTTAFGGLCDVTLFPVLGPHFSRYVVSSCWCKVWSSPSLCSSGWCEWKNEVCGCGFFFFFFSSVNLKTEFIHFLRGGHAIQNVELLIIHLLCKKWWYDTPNLCVQWTHQNHWFNDIYLYSLDFLLFIT